MRQKRLPIFSTVAAAYREWWRMMQELRVVLACAFVIVLAASALTDLIPARLSDQELTGEGLTLLQEAIDAVLLAPILIAIHRFVILDQTSRAYLFPIGEPTFRRYIVWLFALNVLTTLPIDLLGVMQALNVPVLTSTFLTIAILVLAIALALRLSTLLPAIAVEASGAAPSQVFADTKGSVLRILTIIVLALVPWFAASALIFMLIGRRVEVVGSLPAMVGLAISSLMQTVALSLLTVVLSLLFIALAAKMKPQA